MIIKNFNLFYLKEIKKIVSQTNIMRNYKHCNKYNKEYPKYKLILVIGYNYNRRLIRKEYKTIK